MDTNPNLESALDYARRGFAVFPVWPVLPNLPPREGFMCACGKWKCEDAGKHPMGNLVKKGLTNASTDESMIRHWWSCRANANIGVSTDTLIVVDVDRDKGGFETMGEIVRKRGKLPPTWRLITGGGGRHVFFRDTTGGKARNTQNVLGQGVDTRSNGGYVIGDKSNHMSGRSYQWEKGLHPDDLPLADVPEWVPEEIEKAGGRAVDWKARAGNDIKEGQGRNTTITSLFGMLLRRRIESKLAVDLVYAWNLVRCHPPLEDNELLKIINSIANRELRRRGQHGRSN